MPIGSFLRWEAIFCVLRRAVDHAQNCTTFPAAFTAATQSNPDQTDGQARSTKKEGDIQGKEGDIQEKYMGWIMCQVFPLNIAGNGLKIDCYSWRNGSPLILLLTQL